MMTKTARKFQALASCALLGTVLFASPCRGAHQSMAYAEYSHVPATVENDVSLETVGGSVEPSSWSNSPSILYDELLEEPTLIPEQLTERKMKKLKRNRWKKFASRALSTTLLNSLLLSLLIHIVMTPETKWYSSYKSKMPLLRCRLAGLVGNRIPRLGRAISGLDWSVLPRKNVIDIDKEDLYSVLGVPGNASTAEIKAAYRRLITAVHPDKYVGSPYQSTVEEQAKNITRAYFTLSSPTRRAEYDLTRIIEPHLLNAGKGHKDPPPNQSVETVAVLFALGIVLYPVLLTIQVNQLLQLANRRPRLEAITSLPVLKESKTGVSRTIVAPPAAAGGQGGNKE